MSVEDDGFGFAVPPDTTDVRAFYDRLLVVAESNNVGVQTLGYVGSYPLLYLARPAKGSPKRVLISAGFHGEEVAGPWGLLHFLESGALKSFRQMSVSFLPLANPTGMAICDFNNAFNEITNSGYCHNDVDPYNGALSREGSLLLKNLKSMSAGLDGFLTLHENVEVDKSYLYALGHSAAPDFVAKRLKSVLSKSFGLLDDGIVDIDGHYHASNDAIPLGARLRNGIVMNMHDGTFEDRMFHEGVPYSICTETPGTKDLLARIRTNSMVIREFLEAIKSIPIQAVQKRRASSSDTEPRSC